MTFSVDRGETLAIVGESGAGKSSVARAICGLVPHTGTVLVEGREVGDLSRRDRRSLATSLQIVFQNPYSSFDPRRRVGDSVAEPIDIHLPSTTTKERDRKVAELLERVDLDPAFARRRPRDLSGGQLQRAAIARAIALNPAVLICDEAVSSLDVSTQTRVVQLVKDLVDESALSCLFITHDLALVPSLAARAAVMQAGRIVEMAPTASIFAEPEHPYTRQLIAAMPIPDPVRQRARRADRAAEGGPTVAGIGPIQSNRE